MKNICKMKFSSDEINACAAYQFGRIDALTGAGEDRFSGSTWGSKKEMTNVEALRSAYHDGYTTQKRQVIKIAVVNNNL